MLDEQPQRNGIIVPYSWELKKAAPRSCKLRAAFFLSPYPLRRAMDVLSPVERFCMDTTSLADCSTQLQSAFPPNPESFGKIRGKFRGNEWPFPLISDGKPPLARYQTWESWEKGWQALTSKRQQKVPCLWQRVPDYKNYRSSKTVEKGPIRL
jgi:hypothetical protein